jgi:hypothetical protein
MGMIFDGRGSGRRAEVDAAYRLLTRSYSESIQHSLSDENGQAYQVIGEADLSSGTTVALYIKNISQTHNLIVTYCRYQILDGTTGAAFPNSSNYFRIMMDREYVSGGTLVLPKNINSGSANNAEVTCYTDNPTLNLEFHGTVIDKWHTKAYGDMNVFNKEGSLILGNSGTLELSYIGDRTDGKIYTRLSFLMMERHSSSQA